jgi:hypothetical protein
MAFGNFFSGIGDNIFAGMTGHYELRPDSTKHFDLTSFYQMDGRGGGGNYSHINSQIAKQIGAAITGRTELIQELKKVYDNEIVQTMLSTLMNDAFESISNDYFMSIEFNMGENGESKITKVIQDEINSFSAKHDLAGLARDIIPDWMLQGEYFLRTKVVKGQGIVEILDDCDTEDYIALYRGRTLDSYFRYNRKGQKYELLHKDELTHFALDSNKLRVRIELDDNIENLPEIIRVGKSVVYPVLNSLRKLNILETTALAMELKRVLSPILVSVDIQPETDVQNVTDIIDKYENYLNDINMEARNAESFSVADILQTASRIKVIPKFSDNKGAIEQIRFDFDNTDLNNRINDVRKNIAMALGIPSFQVAFGDQLLGKTDMLKVYSAYARKLVGIQTAFGNGMKSMILKHLMHKGLFVNESSISVKFKAVTNVDMIDDIEVLVAVMTSVNEFFNTIGTIVSNDNFGFDVDREALLDTFNSFTSSFPHLQKVLKLYNAKGIDGKLKNGGFEMPSGGAGKGGPQKTEFPGSKLSTPSGAPAPQGNTPTPPPAKPETPATPPNNTNNSPETPKGGEVSIGDVF